MKNAIVYICGMKGSGKTWLANELANEAYRRGRRVILISSQRDMQLPGAPVIDHSGYDWSRLQGRSAVVYPDCEDLSRLAVRFSWLCQERALAPLWLVIDEIQALFPPAKPDYTLRRLIWYGRHRRINLVATCQRPAQVHKDLLALADRKVFFRVQEPNDLLYLRKWAGVDPDRLRSLPDRKFFSC